MQFTKMEGAGNDYIYVDCFQERITGDLSELARRMSDRHFGVGGDGLVLITPSEQADARMRMFNADGSEAQMCGNAIRCVAKYVYEHGIARKPELTIETGRGLLTLQLEVRADKVDRVRVNMGGPILKAADIPTTLPGDPPINVRLELRGERLEGKNVRHSLLSHLSPLTSHLSVTCVSMGNPHCVTFVDEVTDDWVHGVGPLIERHPAFPERVNAEFVKVLSPTEIQMRVWERGSGETLACGTGACAALVACVLRGLTDRSVTCHLLGGDLDLEWSESGDVHKTGPAVEVFSGEWFRD